MKLLRKLWRWAHGVPLPGAKKSVDRFGPKYYVYEEWGRRYVTYRGEEMYALITSAINGRRRR